MAPDLSPRKISPALITARTAQYCRLVSIAGLIENPWSMSVEPPLADIAARILAVRGHRVLIDHDLAALYGVTVKRLNQQVRRNLDKFPGDFLLQLQQDEVNALRMQFASLKAGRGAHRKHPPMAFTEHGAIMAATVLNSPQAVQMSVFIVRAFVRLRTLFRDSGQLGVRLDALEESVAVLDADARRQFKELRAIVFSLASPPAREQ